MTANNYLPMYPEYLEPIRQKKKTQTIRRGFKCSLHLGPAWIVSTEPGSSELVTIFIYNLELRRFRSIDDFDAGKEGYEHAADLKKALLKIYPDLKPDDWLTVIAFRIYEPTDFRHNEVSLEFRQEMLDALMEEVSSWEEETMEKWIKSERFNMARFQMSDEQLLEEYHRVCVNYKSQKCRRGEKGICPYCARKGV